MEVILAQVYLFSSTIFRFFGENTKEIVYRYIAKAIKCMDTKVAFPPPHNIWGRVKAQTGLLLVLSNNDMQKKKSKLLELGSIETLFKLS